MRETKDLICITCPMGCALTVELEDGKVCSVTGNSCKRGISYAEAEAVHPTRMLTTTVRVTGGICPLASVKTASPIPKELLMRSMEALNHISLPAPVHRGQVVCHDLLGCGVDVIATSEAD